MTSIFDSPSGNWTRVSSRLATIRIIIAGLLALPFLAVGVVLLFVLAWLGGIILALTLAAFGWICWWAPRNQRSWGYTETDEALYIVSGRFWRQMVAIPYGRIQYADVASGPLAMKFGVAELIIHTASPHTSGAIPGVPQAEATRLRDRLTEMADAWSPGV